MPYINEIKKTERFFHVSTALCPLCIISEKCRIFQIGQHSTESTRTHSRKKSGRKNQNIHKKMVIHTKMSWWLCCSVLCAWTLYLYFELEWKWRAKKKYKIKSMTDYETRGSEKKLPRRKRRGKENKQIIRRLVTVHIYDYDVMCMNVKQI